MAPPPWASKTRPVQSNYPAFQQQQEDVVFDPTGMSTNIQRKQSIPSEVLVQTGIKSTAPKPAIPQQQNFQSYYTSPPQQEQRNIVPQWQNPQQPSVVIPQWQNPQANIIPQWQNPQHQQQFINPPQANTGSGQFFQPQQAPYLYDQSSSPYDMNTIGQPQAQQKIAPKPATVQHNGQPMQHQQRPAPKRPTAIGHQQVANVYQPVMQQGGGDNPAAFLRIMGSGAQPGDVQQQQAGQKKRRWTVDKLRATDAIIPLQSGTNQFSSQRGMTGFGTPRDVRGKHVHRLWEEEYPEFMVDYYSQQQQ